MPRCPWCRHPAAASPAIAGPTADWSGNTTSTSMIGLASRPGTAVLPTCSVTCATSASAEADRLSYSAVCSRYCGFLAVALVPRLPAFRVTAGLSGGAKIAAVVLAQGVLLALADVRVLVD